jgi:hypothetical protein
MVNGPEQALPAKKTWKSIWTTEEKSNSLWVFGLATGKLI